MTLIANAADRLLAAIVPHAEAAAWSCPPGCVRQTKGCGCFTTEAGSYWYQRCVSADTGAVCVGCRQTDHVC
jgi:hypothetical protein